MTKLNSLRSADGYDPDSSAFANHLREGGETVKPDLKAVRPEVYVSEEPKTELTDEQQKLTPGQIIKEMIDIRDERSAIAKRDKELVELWRAFEARLLAIADEQGMKRIGSDLATATVTEDILPVLEDMDALWLFMKEHDAPHLLQRRVSSSAYRELQDAGIDVPGLTPYVQRKISLRKR